MLAALGILSFAVAFATARILVSAFGRLALDHPNARSLHARPVPRTGGVAVLLGALASAPFAFASLWLVLVLALVLATVSFLDDMHGVPTTLRLAFHLGAASALVGYVVPSGHWIELVLLGLGVTWVTNLFNFMDGSDGLAGGMALIGFGAYAIAAHAAGHMAIVAFSVALAAAAAAFLVFNFHPARIFLGDVGSVPLGFLAAALGLVGWADGAWPLWFPVLVFGLFICDATLTLLKRVARRERVWEAHRQHYYQRLVQLGAGHRGTALTCYAVMVMCAAAALYARNQAPGAQIATIGAAALLMAALAAWIDLRWTRRV
jgi:UDP-N-acetylmuramyl pentapeptide phosphotransferase/UDP-N-acetylglucosamine-1-phosphate transferase